MPARPASTTSARASAAANLPRPDASDGREEAGAGRRVRPRGHGHRLRRGPGGDADRADQRADRAPADPRQGPPLAPRAAEDGRQAAPSASLSGEQRPGALSLAGLRARPPPLASRAQADDRAG